MNMIKEGKLSELVTVEMTLTVLDTSRPTRDRTPLRKILNRCLVKEGALLAL